MKSIPLQWKDHCLHKIFIYLALKSSFPLALPGLPCRVPFCLVYLLPKCSLLFLDPSVSLSLVLPHTCSHWKKISGMKQCKGPTDDFCQAECIRRIHWSKKSLDQEEVNPLFQALSLIWGHIMTSVECIHPCTILYQRQKGGIWTSNFLKSFCKPQCKCLCCKVRKISPASRAPVLVLRVCQYCAT